MRVVRKRRSAVFSVVTKEPENEQEGEAALTDWESAEDRVRANLDLARKLCDSWKEGSGKEGSDEIVREIINWAHFLQCELDNPRGRDPWRVADFAMTLAKWWRDLEANEVLHNVLRGKETSRSNLKIGRGNGKPTPEKIREVRATCKSDKAAAWILGISVKTVARHKHKKSAE